jgi:hypothetical protein
MQERAVEEVEAEVTGQARGAPRRHFPRNSPTRPGVMAMKKNQSEARSAAFSV